MTITTHIPIKFYYDRKLKRLDSASRLRRLTGLQPYYNKERFTYVGAWQCNQNMPFISADGTKILRSYYNELQIIMELKNV